MHPATQKGCVAVQMAHSHSTCKEETLLCQTMLGAHAVALSLNE